jgi:hypothetical protein
MSDIFNNEDSTVWSAPTPEDSVVEEPKNDPIVEEAPVVEPVVVEEPKEEPVMVQALAPLENGAIGVANVVKEVKKAAPKKSTAKKDTVAIHSTRNVTWSGVGKVYRGFNIVAKDDADKWLTRDHCRLATPEEVAKEYGK